METNTKSNKKIIINTIIIMLFIEFVFVIVLGFIVYVNYEKLTSADSGVSDSISQIKIKDLTLDVGDIGETYTGTGFYQGRFGKINYYKNIIDESDLFSSENNILYEINLEEISKHIVIKYLNEKGILDEYLYKGLYDSLDIEKELNNITTFSALLGKISEKESVNLSKKITEEQLKVRNQLVVLVKQNNPDKISEYLFKLEKDLNINLKLLPKNLYQNHALVNDENFQYILSKLYSSDHYPTIKDISSKVEIDDMLMISAIGVEQLRYLMTDRGYAKNLIKQSLPLTNFNKFSYGIGGIKVDTFKKINSDLIKFDEEKYEKYFKKYDELAKNDNGVYLDNSIQNILEDDYAGTLYVAGLLYSIEKKWESSGFPIDDFPGIIITIYNIGNEKEPHGNPDVGGSKIKLDNGMTYYFGEIGFIMYYYIKYYL